MLIFLFEVLAVGDKFIDHLLSASLVLSLFGTGIIQLNELKNKTGDNNQAQQDSMFAGLGRLYQNEHRFDSQVLFR